jgi:hypothetical protein
MMSLSPPPPPIRLQLGKSEGSESDWDAALSSLTHLQLSNSKFYTKDEMKL